MSHYPPPPGYAPPGGYGPAGGYSPPQASYGAGPYGAPPAAGGQPEYSPPPPGYEQAPPGGYAPPAADPYAAYGGYDNYMRQYGGQPPPPAASGSYPPPEASAYPPQAGSYPPPGQPASYGAPPPPSGYAPPDQYGAPPPPAGSYPPPASYPPPPDAYGSYGYGGPPPGAPPPPGYGVPPPAPGYGPSSSYSGYGAPAPGYGPPPGGYPPPPGQSSRGKDRGGGGGGGGKNKNEKRQQQEPKQKNKEEKLDPDDPLAKIRKWQKSNPSWIGVWLEGIDPPRKPIATPNVTVLLLAHKTKKAEDFGFILTSSRQAPKRKDRERECTKECALLLEHLPLAKDNLHAWCRIPPSDSPAPNEDMDRLTDLVQDKVPEATLEFPEPVAFVVVTASAFGEKAGGDAELGILDRLDPGFGELLKEARRVSGLARKQWFIAVVWAKLAEDEGRPLALGVGLATDKTVARQRALYTAEARAEILSLEWFDIKSKGPA